VNGTIPDYPAHGTSADGALLVLGATGCLGGALVASALKAGRPVIAVGRDAEALAALRMQHADAALTTLAATVASDADAADLVSRIRALGLPIAGAIAAIRGSPVRGRLLDQPGEALRRRIDEDLLPHLFAARHLLPMLSAQARGTYVLIGGPGADYPWAGYGQDSIAAAALRMLARVLHDEARALGVHVHLLGVDAPLRTPSNARHACPEWPSLGAVARRAVAMATSPGVLRDAIVRYGDASPPSSFWSDDGDALDTAPLERRVPARAQDSDGHDAADAERSLHDARRLLRGIASSPRLEDRLSP